MEQVFFNVPLVKLEPIFKGWVKDVLAENQPQQVEPTTLPDQLLTIQQAADFLHLSVPTLYSKTSKRELPCMKQGKRLYFSQKELVEYLKQGRKKTTGEIEAEAEAYLSNKKRLNNGK
ncbi:MAG: helix-turn-helix domain-containing protein [Bacteroidales bacterium]|nr:helix-turn-helix domain-containing protein [Bacteroidales bacterium]MBN2747902.1 helix-turn-helix domain-containing protein [Bacteroidales bacterium]